MISLRIILPILFFGLIAIKNVAQQDTLATKSYDELKEMITSYQGIRKSDALEISKYYVNRATLDKNPTQQILGYEALGIASAYVTGADGYTEALSKALSIAEDANLYDEIKRLEGEMAQSYFYLGAWGKSLDFYNKILLYAQEENEYQRESSILAKIASIKIFAGDKNEALKISRLALKKALLIPEDPDSVTQKRRKARFDSHYTLIRIFRELGNPDSSLYHVDKVLALSKLKDSCTMKYVYALQAESYLDKNNTVEADKALTKADNICKSIHKRSAIIMETTRGRLYLYQKKYRKSVDAFLKGIRDYGVKESEEGFMDEIYKNLAKAYKGEGKLDSANYYLEKYINTSSELDKIKKSVYTATKKQEGSAFQKELKLLSKQKARKENLLVYGSIAGGVIIILLIVSLIKTNERRKENEIKFKTLLDKVDNAKAPKDIIDTKDEVLEEQTSSDINPETTQQILDGLKKLEDQNYYLHPACSAHNVAKRIKTNTTYLSKVINAEFGKNFSTYINDLRINHAIVRLKQDSKFRSYTISSIATELGYKSADSFTKYFKKDTGLLPSFYIKKLNETT